MKKILTSIIIGICAAFPIAAQPGFGGPTIEWNATIKSDAYREGNSESAQLQLVLTGKIKDGWHTYDLHDEYSATTLEFTQIKGATLAGAPQDKITGQIFQIIQPLTPDTANSTSEQSAISISGVVEWRSCLGNNCKSPEDWEFTCTTAVGAAVASQSAIVAGEASESAKTTAEAAGADVSILSLILEAILWGLAMLLTPCVFPMVPLTVSFFLRSSKNASKGKMRALLYGLFIVLLYTIPICVIIGLTRVLGGAAVTADIFNWLSTHWLPNLLFFCVFITFAVSFFGFFEITLPSKWTNGADSKSSTSGLSGIFFLALTLVLVSFSCTGPIVGTVLIKSVQGEFWAPMITMLAFSIAFALPFTVLALFPGLLKKLPKSGGWMETIKIVLGFIEIALALKFISTADQTYHWGLLSRNLYLGIWIVCFTLMTIYLLGGMRFPLDQGGKVSTVRKVLAAVSGAFVIYLCTGLNGAPLKALSGYLPPMESTAAISTATTQTTAESKTASSLLQEAQKESAYTGKYIFVDVTGYGCVNCREMNARVLSDQRIQNILSNNFVTLEIYTDDKTKLPESAWVTTPSGKVLKDVGRVNSDYVLRTFGVNSQPAYIIMDSEGNVLSGPRGYDLDIEAFINFLMLR